MARRGAVISTSDSTKIQRMKVNFGNGDLQDKIERIQNFGLTGVPKKNAQVLVLFVNGNRDNPVIVACDDGNFRVHVEEGEVAVYNAFGAVVKLTSDGMISMGDGSVLAPTAGVVTGECLDPFTGVPHADKSLIVKAQKV